MSQLPGIFYNPPQPTQLTPHWFAAGPAAPPVRSMVLWPAIAGIVALNNPPPTWGYEVQCAATALQRQQFPPPAQPAQPPKQPPNQQPVWQWPQLAWASQETPNLPIAPPSILPWSPQPIEYEVLGTWIAPTWGAAQSNPDNTYPPQPVLPLASPPDQQTIGLWSTPTWSAQVNQPSTGNLFDQLTPPPQPLSPPTRQPDQEAVAKWPILTWSAQSAPDNAYPSQAVAPPLAPSQAPIAQWALPTWNTQEEPFLPIIQVTMLPWSPQAGEYENVWPQVSWDTQRAKLNAYPLQASAPPASPSQAPIPQWSAATWSSQEQPLIPIIPVTVLPWFPEPLFYENSWPQTAWGPQSAVPNTYPAQASVPPKPFSQAPIGQWQVLNWNTQTLPVVQQLAAGLPWAPQAIDYEVLGSWTLPSWSAQSKPTLPFGPGPVPHLLAPSQAPVGTWALPTWGTQTLPITSALYTLGPLGTGGNRFVVASLLGTFEAGVITGVFRAGNN